MKLPMKNRAAAVAIVLLSSIWCVPARANDHGVSYEDQDQSAQTAPPSRQSTANSDHDWHLTLTPYLWFAGVSGTTGVFGHDANMHVSAGDFTLSYRAHG